LGRLRKPALTPPSSSSARGRLRASLSSTLVEPAFTTMFKPDACNQICFDQTGARGRATKNWWRYMGSLSATTR